MQLKVQSELMDGERPILFSWSFRAICLMSLRIRSHIAGNCNLFSRRQNEVITLLHLQPHFSTFHSSEEDGSRYVSLVCYWNVMKEIPNDRDVFWEGGGKCFYGKGNIKRKWVSILWRRRLLWVVTLGRSKALFLSGFDPFSLEGVHPLSLSCSVNVIAYLFPYVSFGRIFIFPTFSPFLPFHQCIAVTLCGCLGGPWAGGSYTGTNHIKVDQASAVRSVLMVKRYRKIVGSVEGLWIKTTYDELTKTPIPHSPMLLQGRW